MYGQEKVKKQEAEEYAKSINASYRCVSALSGTGLNELFFSIAKSLINSEEKESTAEESSKQGDNKEFTLKKENKSKKHKEKKICCQ